MGYSPSPRPTFAEPTHRPYASVTRHLWGDPEAGEVADWIYVSSQRLHHIVFGLAPGGWFRHSDSFRTIFAADELLYVVSGEMILSNPQSGEVHLVRTGEAAFFRRDTWHHAFNQSGELLKVSEFFSPPPSQGTSGAYAQTKPNLTVSRYGQDEALGRWPMEEAAIRAGQTIRVLRDENLLWRREGEALVGLYASTEHLTAGRIHLLPGQRSDVQRHGGDESLLLLEGTLHIHCPEKEGQQWFELTPQDGFYIPAGAPHRYYNMTGQPVSAIFGVAPDYLSVGA